MKTSERRKKKSSKVEFGRKINFNSESDVKHPVTLNNRKLLGRINANPDRSQIPWKPINKTCYHRYRVFEKKSGELLGRFVPAKIPPTAIKIKNRLITLVESSKLASSTNSVQLSFKFTDGIESLFEAQANSTTRILLNSTFHMVHKEKCSIELLYQAWVELFFDRRYLILNYNEILRSPTSLLAHCILRDQGDHEHPKVLEERLRLLIVRD